MTVTADSVPNGYHNAPERSATVFRREADGVMTFAHGDLAYRDDAGIFHSFGRKDQQIKIRGYNVHPLEVEQVMLEHPSVKAVAVAPFDLRHGIPRLACFYVPKPGAPLSGGELRAFIVINVPNLIVPSVFVELEQLPVTATGKLNRNCLPDPMASWKVDEALAWQGLAAFETSLVNGCIDVPRHSDFSLEDDFFDVDGDSLQAMAILVAVERDTQIRVPVESLILEGASIRSFAARIGDGTHDGGVRPPVAMKRAGTKLTFFATHVMGRNLSDYQALQAALDPQQPLDGLHPKGMDGQADPDTSIEYIAAHCIRSMKLQKPEGPHWNIGYSFGTYLAFEMACHLY